MYLNVEEIEYLRFVLDMTFDLTLNHSHSSVVGDLDALNKYPFDDMSPLWRRNETLKARDMYIKLTKMVEENKSAQDIFKD